MIFQMRLRFYSVLYYFSSRCLCTLLFFCNMMQVFLLVVLRLVREHLFIAAITQEEAI